MRKPLTIDNIIEELREKNRIVEVGYPYYDVPQVIKRAIRLLCKIKKEVR